jgi:hypothetical protein
MGQEGLLWSSVIARSQLEWLPIGGRAKSRDRGGAIEVLRARASSEGNWSSEL